MLKKLRKILLIIYSFVLVFSLSLLFFSCSKGIAIGKKYYYYSHFDFAKNEWVKTENYIQFNKSGEFLEEYNISKLKKLTVKGKYNFDVKNNVAFASYDRSFVSQLIKEIDNVPSSTLSSVEKDLIKKSINPDFEVYSYKGYVFKRSNIAAFKTGFLGDNLNDIEGMYRIPTTSNKFLLKEFKGGKIYQYDTSKANSKPNVVGMYAISGDYIEITNVDSSGNIVGKTDKSLIAKIKLPVSVSEDYKDVADSINGKELLKIKDGVEISIFLNAFYLM